MRFDLTLASSHIFEKDLGFGRFTGHSKYSFFYFYFFEIFFVEKSKLHFGAHQGIHCKSPYPLIHKIKQ